MPEASYGQSNRWLTVIQVDASRFGASPEEIRLQFEEQNIEARPVWKPLHLQPVFSGCRCRGEAVAEEIFAKGLCLPSSSSLTESDLTRVVVGIKAAAKRGADSTTSRRKKVA